MIKIQYRIRMKPFVHTGKEKVTYIYVVNKIK